jgi:hypothetical protein
MGPWQRGRKDDGDAAGQEGGEGEQRVPGRVSQREDTDAERADAEERGGISTALRRSARSTNQLAGAASPLSASVGFSVLPGSTGEHGRDVRLLCYTLAAWDTRNSIREEPRCDRS